MNNRYDEFSSVSARTPDLEPPHRGPSCTQPHRGEVVATCLPARLTGSTWDEVAPPPWSDLRLLSRILGSVGALSFLGLGRAAPHAPLLVPLRRGVDPVARLSVDSTGRLGSSIVRRWHSERKSRRMGNSGLIKLSFVNPPHPSHGARGVPHWPTLAVSLPREAVV